MIFTLNQSYEPKIGAIKAAPPFGIIKLNNTCKSANKYLQLPEYFGKHSHFERSDPLQILLKLHNISQFSIWNDSKAEFKKFWPISLPSHLFIILIIINVNRFVCSCFAKETLHSNLF